MHKQRVGSLLTLSLLAVALGGCAPRIYGDKTVIEWSRSRQVGMSSAGEPAALAVAPRGEWIALVWPASPSRGVDVLHLATLNAEGVILSDLDLALTVTEPAEPRMVVTADGRLHLTWADKWQDNTVLRSAQFTHDGELLAPPQSLSAPDRRVRGHQLAALPTGDVLVIWADYRGLMAARLAADGLVQATGLLDAENATHPSLQLDATGTGHLVWQQSYSPAEKRLFYASLDAATLTFSGPRYLATVRLRASSGLGGSPEQLNGPILALEEARAVVSWGIGESAGSNDNAFYLDFRPAELQELAPRRITVPPAYPPDYAPATGALPYRQLADPLPAAAAARRAFLRATPATITAQSEEVPLAVSLWVRTMWGVHLQPAVVVVDEGQVKGFQVVGWSRFPSLHPSLVADEDGSLYMAWLDATGRTYAVHLASTDDELREAWDRLTPVDLSVTLERWFGRLLSALGLLVIALSWIVLPGLLLIVTLFVFREDRLDTTRGRAVLFLLIGLHWAAKYLLTPDLLAGLPRMRDLPLIFPSLTLLFPNWLAYLPNRLHPPASVSPLVPFLVPGLTLIAGAIVVRLGYLARRRYPNLIFAYLILAVVDIFFALQIYGLAYYDPTKF